MLLAVLRLCPGGTTSQELFDDGHFAQFPTASEGGPCHADDGRVSGQHGAAVGGESAGGGRWPRRVVSPQHRRSGWYRVRFFDGLLDYNGRAVSFRVVDGEGEPLWPARTVLLRLERAEWLYEEYVSANMVLGVLDGHARHAQCAANHNRSGLNQTVRRST